MYDNDELVEKLILVGVSVTDGDDTKASLDELAELIKTAGAQSVGYVVQNRENIHPGMYVGTGKIQEIRDLAIALDATGIVCDDELSPAQLKNLEDELQIKVMDRTLVILDIFAKRASTSEGKIQVELAQLKYRQTRLVGLRDSLSRLGGGIGTRGPGEKKIEMDRRLIKDRIAQLNRELEDVKKHRELTRRQRSKHPNGVIAIVGYTNAGKSTLLNTLTQAKVLEEDKLFATLDPTTRTLVLDNKEEILVTDTVGFIRKLPHNLIDAFRSTLEEAKYADIIMHVIDASNPDMDVHMQVVYDTLRKLGVGDKPIITLFNKVDKLEEKGIYKDLMADECFYVSAKTGEGLDKVKEAIEQILTSRKEYIEKVYDYSQAGKIQTIRKYGQLISEEYTENGIEVKAYVPREFLQLI